MVVLMQIIGIWLKDGRAGTKCKLLYVKDYGELEADFNIEP